MVIIDATGAVVGRLSATVAKKILAGEEVIITNIEKAVFSGDPVKIAARYLDKRGIQNKSNPEHSPKWPRRADYLFKKIISGMLPKRSSRSAAALKRLRAYYGVPKELEGKPAEKHAKKLACRTLSMEELSARLGFKSG